MSKENLSLVLQKVQSFAFEDRPIPSLEGDYDVLLKILCVGICGSDVHYWSKGFIGDFVVKEPIVLGHETAAVVVKCGRKVSNLQEGDRVAIEPGIPCRRCCFCLSGRYNLCKEMKFHATPPVDGTLCRYIIHPADFCFKLPDHVSNEEGAFVEPLSVAVHACRRAGVAIGSKILIIGAGPIGLVNILVARSMSAEKIVVVDIDKSRLELAKSIGADFAISITPETDCKSIIEQLKTDLGCLPNISIECSGAPKAIELGILATDAGGCFVIVGMGPPVIQAPVLSALCREVDLRGIFRYANCYPAALSLLEQGKIDVKPLITHRYSFNDAVKAFETVKQGNGVKVMIEVD